VKDLKDNCGDEFKGYTKCLWTNQNNFVNCRAEERKFRSKCPVPEEVYKREVWAVQQAMKPEGLP